MSLSRPLVALIGVGVLGIATVGAGAGATFTDATHSLQSVTAGTIDVTLNSPGAFNNDSKTISFASLNLPGSTFLDPAKTITMTNHGTIAANYVYLNVSVLSASPPQTPPDTKQLARDAQLATELNVCIWSPQTASGDPIVYDGPLDYFAGTPGGLGQQILGAIPPKEGSETYSVEFYVGDVKTKCGQSGAGSLSQEAMGGSLATSIDITYEG